MLIIDRKAEHIQIVTEKEVTFKEKTTGFEQYDFIHCALPELDFDDVHTETEFLDKKLSFPLMISALTGGFEDALHINRQLGEVCHVEKIALGVASQRQMMENDRFLESYQIVRKMAPEGVVIGNIGAAQIANINDLSPVEKMVDLIEADALAVHLNPLQEILQPEGDTRFSGILAGIETLVCHLGVPIIVKEIGCGISETVARQLASVGVKYIDLAGAGGTSWAAVESYRCEDLVFAQQFRDWGIPTATALENIRSIEGLKVIASGGIRDGFAFAKALALGADLGGAALPILQALKKGGKEELLCVIRFWLRTLKTIMFLTGCSTINDLKNKPVLMKTNS